MPKAAKLETKSVREAKASPLLRETGSKNDDPDVDDQVQGRSLTVKETPVRETAGAPNPCLGPSLNKRATTFQRNLEERVAQPEIQPLTTGSREGAGGNQGRRKTGVPAVAPTPTPMSNGGLQFQRLKDDRRREADQMKSRILHLERSEERLKRKLGEKAELFKDMKVERDEARTEWLRAEERLEERGELLHAINRDLDRYRGWWLTEYYCLKVVLRLIPESERSGVEAISASSLARFEEHSK